MLFTTAGAPWVLGSKVALVSPATNVVVGKFSSTDVLQTAAIWEFPNSDLFYFRGENSVGGGNIFAGQFANASADASAEFTAYRSRGTLAAPTAVQAGDRMWRAAAEGLGSDIMKWSSGIDQRAAAGWNSATSAYAGEIIFMTRTAAGSAPTDVVKVASTGALQLSVGAVSNPGLAFISDTDTGLYWVSDGIYLSRDSVAEMRIGTNAVQLPTAGVLQWGTGDPGSTADVKLNRGAAAVLELKNSTTAQEFRVYGSTTGPIYGSVQHDGTSLLLFETTSGGGGTRLGKTGGKIAFYGTAPIAKQAGVSVTAAGIHAACVALGLFS